MLEIFLCVMDDWSALFAVNQLNNLKSHFNVFLDFE